MRGSPRASAICFTGDAANAMPRPRGRSGCVTTNFTRKPAHTSFSSVGAANIGVPQNTRSIMEALPFALLHQLADLAFHHVPLKRADVVNVELPVEMIGFMHQGARQQIFPTHFKRLPLQILGTRRNL